MSNDNQNLEPCSDGNCILLDKSKPRGMHTNGGCQHIMQRGPQLQMMLRDMGAEIVRLRRLPVIATCYDCAHAETSPHADVCVHPAAGGRVEHGGKLPPPGHCPLRGGAR